jgi:hypothetical protein
VLTRVAATRYVTPLREGGSLPGLVEADDLGTYVVKFRRSGQGPRVLAAEIIVAALARAIGVRVPELVLVDLGPEMARYEADEEVQELLTASVGLNLGIDFLPGSFGPDPRWPVDPTQAAAILWLDALVANVDRTWRNPNLLLWHRRLWCIDHGAALYFHHSWESGSVSAERFATQPYDASQHVLRSHVDAVAGLDTQLAAALTPTILAAAVADVPDEWLAPVPALPSVAAQRGAYLDHLERRLGARPSWLPGPAA